MLSAKLKEIWVDGVDSPWRGAPEFAVTCRVGPSFRAFWLALLGSAPFPGEKR